MDDDFSYVSLRCNQCSSLDCDVCPIGTWVDSSEECLRGCTRRVSDDDIARYVHLREEVLPFCKDFDSICRTCDELYEVEQSISHAPIGQRLDDKGKVVVGR